MPKQKVEFIAVLDDDSEDEIEVIPYVKPAPVIIEILESDSGNESSPKKKKKSKRKKSSKDKERSSNVASHEPEAESTAQSQGERERENNNLVKPNNEGSVRGVNEQTEISPEKNSVPINVANDTPSVSCDKTTPLRNFETGMSSNLGQCNGTQGNADDSVETVTGAELSGTAQTPKQKDKQKVNEKKRRARTNSATQRTNEEIVNFLTTLGIQMEPSAFETPPKRRRQSKKPSPDGPPEEVNQSVLTNSTTVQNPADSPAPVVDNVPGSFVSVTQEITKPSPAKGKRLRQAIVGDIYDFRISSTSSDRPCPTITTSFQSNIINLNKEPICQNPVSVASVSTLEIVIDAVARGEISDLNKEKDGDNPSLTDTQPNDTVNPVENMEICEAQVSVEETRPQELNKSVNNVEIPAVELEVCEVATQPLVDVPIVPAKANDPAPVKVTGSNQRTEINPKSNKLTDRKRSRIESPSDANSPSGPKKTKPITQTCIFIPSINEFTIETPAPHLPSTWTNEMREFYDSAGNENFDCGRLMRRMSDSYGKWAVNQDLMGAPRNKPRRNIRCDNCNQMGHLKRECTERTKVPICHMCGEDGHTSTSDPRAYSRRPCPHAFCLNCGRKQLQFSQRCNQCLMRWDPKRCETCNVMGHHKSVCPDNWRTFHSVTSPVEHEKALLYLQSKKNSSSYSRSTFNSAIYIRRSSSFCSNCGMYGHLYYDCSGIRFNPYCRNKPFVINELPEHITQPPVVQTIQTETTVSTIVPISYDAKTGRTVVMNAQEKKRPNLAVETIQVKITNELAINSTVQPSSSQVKQNVEVAATSSSPGSRLNDKQKPSSEQSPKATTLQTGQCYDKGCSNKTSGSVRCTQSIVMTQVHNKLMKTQDSGTLKSFEDKHSVQICVLKEGKKVHYYGTNLVEAEKDLYRYLWQLDRDSQKQNSEANKAKSVTKPKDPLPAVFTVEEDDDDCCIIDELPVSSVRKTPTTPRKSALAVMAETSTASGKETIETKDSARAQLHSDETSSSFTSDTPCVPAYTSFESSFCPKATTSGKNVPPKSAPPPPPVETASKSSFIEYESPLAGMSCGDNLVPDSSNEIIEMDLNETKVKDLNEATEKNLNEATEKDSNEATQNDSNEAVEQDLNANCSQDASIPTVNECVITLTQDDNANADKPSGKTTRDESSSDDSSSDSDEGVKQVKAAVDPTNANASADKPSRRPSRLESSSEESSSDDDVELVEVAAPTKHVEVITLDEDEDDDENVEEPNSSPTFSSAMKSLDNAVKITLLQSEWKVATEQCLLANSAINSISSKLNVDLQFSKELSCIFVLNGSMKNRRIAKDNLVYWLECQSRNSTYHFLPNGYKELTHPKTVKPVKKVIKNSVASRIKMLARRKKLADSKTTGISLAHKNMQTLARKAKNISAKLKMKKSRLAKSNSVTKRGRQRGAITTRNVSTRLQNQQDSNTPAVFIKVPNSPSGATPAATSSANTPNGTIRGARYFQTT